MSEQMPAWVPRCIATQVEFILQSGPPWRTLGEDLIYRDASPRLRRLVSNDLNMKETWETLSSFGNDDGMLAFLGTLLGADSGITFDTGMGHKDFARDMDHINKLATELDALLKSHTIFNLRGHSALYGSNLQTPDYGTDSPLQKLAKDALARKAERPEKIPRNIQAKTAKRNSVAIKLKDVCTQHFGRPLHRCVADAINVWFDTPEPEQLTADAVAHLAD